MAKRKVKRRKTHDVRHHREYQMQQVGTGGSAPFPMEKAPLKVFNWLDHSTRGRNRYNWKILIAAGQDATTSLIASRTYAYFSSGFAQKKYVSGTTVTSSGNFAAYLNGYNDVSAPSDSLYQKALTQAETNFTRSVRKTQASWKSGEFFGEIMQAVNLVKHPLKALEGNSIKHVKDIVALNGKLKKLKYTEVSRLKALTDSHLAFQFGVKPLLSDIESAMAALANTGVVRPRNGCRGNGEADEVTKATNQLIQAVEVEVPVKLNMFNRTTYEVTIRGKLIDQGPTGSTVWEETGLTPDNWVPTLYQLFPYSFALDYFSNTGAVIDAYCLRFVEFAWLNQTDRWERFVKVHNCLPKDGSGAIAYGGESRVITTGVHRYVRTNVFCPAFQVQLPGLKQGLNLAALANTFEWARRHT